MTEKRINRDSFEPAYIQLTNILRDLISRGVYRSGDRLPSESQLCKTYKVSPMTVRRAINSLIVQDVVSTAQGKGTFVKPLQLSSVTFGLDQFQGMFSGADTEVKILEARIQESDENVSAKLSIPLGSRTILIRRLLSRNGEPWIYNNEHLIYDPRRPVVEAEMVVSSLNGLFSGERKSDFKWGKLSVCACVLSDQDARQLRCFPGSPAFLLEHLFYDFNDKPVSWGLFVCRGDRFNFSVTVGRSNESCKESRQGGVEDERE
jgi:DNA-binding GntR family transcriptional regulator